MAAQGLSEQSPLMQYWWAVQCSKVGSGVGANRYLHCTLDPDAIYVSLTHSAKCCDCH